MIGLRILIVAFGAAGLILAAGRSIAAQTATPQAGTGVELPAGVTRQNLAVGSAAPLLPGPSTIELVRFIFAPGAVVALPEASPSLALVYVESGTLSVRIDAPVTLTRAAANGSSEEPEAIPAGTPFTAEAGDFFVGPPHVAVEARNDGSEPLALLMAVLEPAPATAAPATPAP
jgi:quercetin dioxygenase-like cupin family protein